MAAAWGWPTLLPAPSPKAIETTDAKPPPSSKLLQMAKQHPFLLGSKQNLELSPTKTVFLLINSDE